MKPTNYLFFPCLALVAVLLMVMAKDASATGQQIDPLQEIKRSFPETLKVKLNPVKSIEFCPDNTCELIVAKKGVCIDNLKDFAYLYIYFFSDYFVLDDWRKSKKAALVAEKILSKPKYQWCKNSDQQRTARCILRHLSKKGRIELYAVRYDENERSLVNIEINSVVGHKGK
jgi:hypothetical protein